MKKPFAFTVSTLVIVFVAVTTTTTTISLIIVTTGMLRTANTVLSMKVHHIAVAFKSTTPLQTSPSLDPPRSTSSQPNQQLPGNVSTSNVSTLISKRIALDKQGNHTGAIQY